QAACAVKDGRPLVRRRRVANDVPEVTLRRVILHGVRGGKVCGVTVEAIGDRTLSRGPRPGGNAGARAGIEKPGFGERRCDGSADGSESILDPGGAERGGGV